MRKIETFIQPVYWDHMHAALAKLGVSGTLRQVKTFGRVAPRREVYRGSAYMQETCNALELSLTVPDELMDATLAAIAEASGDAEVIVSSVQVLGGARASRPRPVASPVVSERPVTPIGLIAAVRA
ncbi:MAG TPA: P-II family nitrogen regulator [Polyangiaceae bacterium]|nr:P-II family nitrogen regulator [Polyangiaceae bacterium]